MLLNSQSFDYDTPRSRTRCAARLASVLASGGDGRIRLDAQGRKQYHASAVPSDALAYGSSTINSISAHAFDMLIGHWRDRLDQPA